MNIDSNILSVNPQKADYPFDFNPAACESCGGQCCTGADGYVFMSVAEMKKIAAFLKLRFDDFTRAYACKVGYKFSLTQKPDFHNVQYPNARACVFLQQGKCRIYPVRPKQCRTFPFWEAHKHLNETALRALQCECKGIIPKNKPNIIQWKDRL